MTEIVFALLGAALINHWLLALPPTAHTPVTHLHAYLSAALIAISLPLAWAITQLLAHIGLPYLFLLSFAAAAAALTALTHCLLRLWLTEQNQPNIWPLLAANSFAAMLAGHLLPDARSALVLAPLAGFGFVIALQLLRDLEQRINACNVPKAFRGAPVMLISTGLSAMALLGLNGIVTP